MKRWFSTLCGVAVLLSVARVSSAQGNPRGTAELMLKGKAVSVEYGRPALKGRTVEQLLGKLKPGGVWRLGADKSTTFSTDLDLAFDDVTVPKGVYSLWARKEADKSWKLVFNKQHGQWGTEHDPALDLFSVPVKESKAAKAEEQVTLTLTSAAGAGVLSIQWGAMALSASFKGK